MIKSDPLGRLKLSKIQFITKIKKLLYIYFLKNNTLMIKSDPFSRLKLSKIQLIIFLIRK